MVSSELEKDFFLICTPLRANMKSDSLHFCGVLTRSNIVENVRKDLLAHIF